MQNRYFGDIGDFGKYGMMRVILKKKLKLGVNWYLYPDEKHNNDGKYIGYLDNDTNGIANCDIELYNYLKNYMRKVKNKQAIRDLHAIEESGLLGNTVFYNEMLDYGDEQNWKNRLALRETWYEKQLDVLQDVDVVFYDPDNGFEVSSVSPTSKYGGKYVLYSEVKTQFNQGKSIIVYHHGPLWFKAGEMEKHIDNLKEKIISNIDTKAAVSCLRWKTIAKRFYFWIMREEHKKAMSECLDTLTHENWGKHFELVYHRKMKNNVGYLN